MKRALILHAMEQTSQGHWYQWLRHELEERGYLVWVPDLPNNSHPDTSEMTQFLLSNRNWDFSNNLIIGHSSGSVEVLYLLQALSPNLKARAAVLVSAFEKPVPGMEAQHDRMFVQKINFEEVSQHTQKLLFIHGDDDPWCPVSGAKNLSEQSGGKLILVHGGGHFSTSLDSEYSVFPELINILDSEKVL